MRILLSRGMSDMSEIDERTRGITQRWFDMVDWRSANVGSAQLEVSRDISASKATRKRCKMTTRVT
jgi:hypothetical protein